MVHGATLAADRFGNANAAYSFDGVNDYVSVPYSPSFDFSQSKEISFGAWVHLETNTGGNIIYHPSPSTHFAFSIDIYKEGQANTNHVGGELHVTNPPNWELAVSPQEIDFNSWQHLFVTADEDYLRLYMNGSEVREVALGGDWITNNFEEDTIIGATKLYYLPNPTDQFVDGKIDEVYVYNRALSASEVATLFAVPEPSTALLLGIGTGGAGDATKANAPEGSVMRMRLETFTNLTICKMVNVCGAN